MKTLISCQNQNANISIPNSVTQIGDWAFAYCDSLESIYVSKEAYDRILKLLGSGYKDKLKIED